MLPPNRRRDEIWKAIERDGIVGPFSWSDMVVLASLLVAYGFLRTPERDPEQTVDQILALIRRRALFIISQPAQDEQEL